jgi:hypothetical protein
MKAMTKKQLLEALKPFNDDSLILVPNQRVASTLHRRFKNKWWFITLQIVGKLTFKPSVS